MYIICQNNQHLSYFCVILFICKVRADGIIQNLLLLPGSRKLKRSKQDSQNLLCLPGSRKHKDSINRTAKICCGYLGAGNSKGLNRQPKSTVVTWEKETQRMVKPRKFRTSLVFYRWRCYFHFGSMEFSTQANS